MSGAIAIALLSILSGLVAVPTRTTQECKDRIALLKKRMSLALAEEYELKTLRVSDNLPRTTGGAIANERGPVVRITADEPTLDGTPLSGKKAKEWLRDFDARFSSTSANAVASNAVVPSWVYVIVDRETNLREQFPFLLELGTRVELRIVTELPRDSLKVLPAAPPPGAQSLLVRLAPVGDDPARTAELATIYGDELSKTAWFCPSIRRLNEAKSVPIPQRSARYAQVLAEVVEECGCNRVDVDALEFISLHLYNAFKAPRRVIRVRFAPEGKKGLPPVAPLNGQGFVDAVAPKDRSKMNELQILRAPSR